MDLTRLHNWRHTGNQLSWQVSAYNERFLILYLPRSFVTSPVLSFIVLQSFWSDIQKKKREHVSSVQVANDTEIPKVDTSL